MSEIEPMKIEDARHIADPSSRHPGAWNRPTIAAAKLAVELADKCERLENITNIRGRHEAIMNSQSTRLGEWVRETGCTSPADANARIQDLARMATEARARAHELEGLLRLRERVTVDQPGATRVPPAPVASDQPAPEVERQQVAIMLDELGAHLYAALVRGCYHCSPDFLEGGTE